MKVRARVAVCLIIATMFLFCGCSTIESLLGIQFSSISEDEKSISAESTTIEPNSETINKTNNNDDKSASAENATVEPNSETIDKTNNNSDERTNEKKSDNKTEPIDNGSSEKTSRAIELLSKMSSNGYAGITSNTGSYPNISMLDGPYSDLPFYLECSSKEGWGVIYPDLSNASGIFKPEPLARGFGVYSFNNRSVRAQACDGYLINNRNEIFIFPEAENRQVNLLTDQTMTELQTFFSNATTVILHIAGRETNSSSYRIGSEAENPITYSVPLDQIKYIYEFIDENLN